MSGHGKTMTPEEDEDTKEPEPEISILDQVSSTMNSVVEMALELITPKEPEPIYEPVTSVSSTIKISPNIDRMEELVSKKFWMRPEDYINSVGVLNAAALAERDRLRAFAATNTWIARHEIRNNVYKDFMANCSEFMVSLILHDQQVAQDSNGHVVYIDRHTRLFTKILNPRTGSSSYQMVRLSMNELDRSSDL
jgi:hypothetical protein